MAHGRWQTFSASRQLVLFMMVRREIACETGMRSREAPSVLERYVEGVSGEPARR